MTFRREDNVWHNITRARGVLRALAWTLVPLDDTEAYLYYTLAGGAKGEYWGVLRLTPMVQ